MQTNPTPAGTRKPLPLKPKFSASKPTPKNDALVAALNRRDED